MLRSSEGCSINISSVISSNYLLFSSGWLTLMAKTFADKPELWLNICLVNSYVLKFSLLIFFVKLGQLLDTNLTLTLKD